MTMSKIYADPDQEAIEALFAEFNEELRSTGRANYGLVEVCPLEHRQELRSLMNVAVLTYRVFQSEREAEPADAVGPRSAII